MCGGNFYCSKNALLGLNISYIVVSFLMIGVATYGKTSAVVDSLPIIGGIAACGVFLLVISVIGLIGTLRHHQVMLFFYMIILLLIFIIQFSVACACIAVNEEQEIKYAYKGWNHSDDATKLDAEKYFTCCGFHDYSEGVSCDSVPGCTEAGSEDYICPPCEEQMQGKINYAFDTAGWIGLIFSFTELVTVAYAYKFRKHLREMAM